MQGVAPPEALRSVSLEIDFSGLCCGAILALAIDQGCLRGGGGGSALGAAEVGGGRAGRGHVLVGGAGGGAGAARAVGGGGAGGRPVPPRGARGAAGCAGAVGGGGAGGRLVLPRGAGGGAGGAGAVGGRTAGGGLVLAGGAGGGAGRGGSLRSVGSRKRACPGAGGRGGVASRARSCAAHWHTCPCSRPIRPSLPACPSLSRAHAHKHEGKRRHFGRKSLGGQNCCNCPCSETCQDLLGTEHIFQLTRLRSH